MKKNILTKYSLIIFSIIIFGCQGEEIKSPVITNEFKTNIDKLVRDYKTYEVSNEDDYNLKRIDLDRTFDNPWAIEFINDNELIITEKNGNLIYVDLNTNSTKFIENNIPSLQVGQGGLLDVLLYKNFLYVSFSIKNENDNFTTAIGRGKLSEDYSKLLDFEILFEALPYYKETVHFGSRIIIHENYLYASIGERGKGNVAQELDSHAGTIIRINLDGSVPKNPYKGQTELEEIYMIGVRNPQGMAIAKDGNLYISNHGAKGGDFIGKIESGGNYGWNNIGWGGKNYIGTSIGSGEKFSEEYNLPILSWVPSIAPSDLIFYEGKEFSDWENDILVTSLKYKLLIKLTLENGKISNEEIIFKNKIGRLRDIDINSAGEIFIITDEKDSNIWKLNSN
tara:strand:+ start:31 stop:1215 length:1185 start_codon:yes stop_codon:yes gene_type:complete